MQRLIKTLALTVCFVSSVQIMAAEPGTLRILSYNIHHGQGVDGKLDLERIAKVISSVNPDLVALQEVDHKMSRSRKVAQTDKLAKLTKLNGVLGSNLEIGGGQYGNAVLSKYPIAKHQNHHLPNLDDGEQRGVLEVEIKLPSSDDRLLFFATHFDHRKDEQERIASAKFINQLTTKRPEQLALLAGDLNDLIGSKTLNTLETTWSRANKKELPTIPVGKPGKQIDFILSRPTQRWQVVEVKVLGEAVASDHRAILAVYKLPPEGN